MPVPNVVDLLCLMGIEKAGGQLLLFDMDAKAGADWLLFELENFFHKIFPLYDNAL